jgi:hypothetical protein
VADIIELEKRRQEQQREKADAMLDEKIVVLKKILQCARCQLKCSRCGTQIEDGNEANNPSLPYPFCSSCRNEYELYLEISREGSRAGRSWHNKEWMKVWRTWLQHQHALDQYRNSKEFIKLLQDFEGFL